jgi:hypothetical protein
MRCVRSVKEKTIEVVPDARLEMVSALCHSSGLNAKFDGHNVIASFAS